jgi:hypothetical protein
MFVDDNVRKCVFFLGTKENGKFQPRATAFVVAIADTEQGGFRYLVTAEHVVSGLLSRQKEIWLRSNLKDGTAREVHISPEHWWFHPDNEASPTDVAVAGVVFLNDEEYLAIPLNGPYGMSATSQMLDARAIGVGHEVFVTGLFRSHYGNQRNIPIVRVGNIAMMRGEPVKTEYCGYTDAYLIEARSVGGLSGSPVFISIPVIVTGGVDAQGKPCNDFVPYQGDKTHLLGLMHGHFDIQNLNEDVIVDDECGVTQGIHTGIGVVIPVEKILETIYHPELVESRRSVFKDHLEDSRYIVDPASKRYFVDPPSNRET